MRNENFKKTKHLFEIVGGAEGEMNKWMTAVT